MEAYRVSLFRLAENLTTQDIEEIRFLLAENISIPDEETGGAKGFMKALERKGLLSCQDLSFLRKLLRIVDRNDLVVLLDKQFVNINGPGASSQHPISSYRKLLLRLSRQLGKQDLEKMKFLVASDIGAGILETISTALQLFSELERVGKVSSEDLTFLENRFKDVPRMDLASMVAKPKGSRTYGLRHLPADFIERSADVLAVIRLLEEGQNSVAVVGKRCNDVVGIKGMGGLGKTVLAQAVCWNIQESRQIIWLTLSQTPNLLLLLNTLASVLYGQQLSFSDLASAQSWIQEYTEDKDCLVVLDDVWDVNHASAFDILSGKCQLLITTRNSDVVRGLRGSSIYKLSHLEIAHARTLLLKSAQVKNILPQEIRIIVEDILRECNGLPLAIALVGASLVESNMDIDMWKDRLNGLKEADLENVRSCFPENSYPYENLMAAIEVSYQSLPERYKNKFLDLAIFPEDTEVPIHVLNIVWSNQANDALNDSEKSKEERRTRDDSSFLERRSVIQRGSTKSCFVIHDILLDYARGKVKQERGINATETQHKSLLDKYKSRCRDGRWAHGPEGDHYYFQKLAYHLCQAGLNTELSCELKNYDWLQTKLQQTDFASLLSDFCHLKTEDDGVKVIRRALTLSSNVLSQNKEQLGAQLLGRLEGLHDNEAVKRLIQQIRQKEAGSSRHLVPLNSCLTPPGGPLIRTTDSRSRTVLSVVVSPKKQKILTGSSDSSIKVWDFDSGKELKKLSGHKKVVYALAISGDGATLVSGSFDCTVKIWDLDSYVVKETLCGHKNWVTGVLLTPNEEWVVSCSCDSTIVVWDLATRKILHTLTGHAGHVRGIAVTPDGRHVVSGSHDCTVKLWSLDTFKTVRTLYGHTDTVYSVCVTPDGKHVISGSEDSTVNVWLLSTGKILSSLAGHSAAVYCVTVTLDNLKIISSSGDRTIRVWSVVTGEELSVLQGHSESVRVVTVTTDSAVVVSGSQDFSYKLWDLTVESHVDRFIGHQRPITAVALAADGLMCLTASRDNLIKVWNCVTFVEMYTLRGHWKPVSTLALHPRDLIGASGSEDFQVKLWDLKTMSESRTFKHEHVVQLVTFSQNGELLVCALQDNKVVLRDYKTDAPTRWIEAPFCGVIDLVLMDNSLLICNGYSLASRVTLRGDRFPHEVYRGPNSNLFPVLVLPSGSGIISGSCQGNHIRFWETNTSLEERTLCGHPVDSIITALDATTDEKEVVTCSDCGTISVFDLSSAKVLCLYNYSLEHNARFTAAKWLPNEGHFVLADSLGELTFWSKRSGYIKALKIFDKVNDMVVLPGGDILVASGRGKLLMVDCNSHQVACSLTAHADSVSAIVGDETGNFIVTGSCDRSIKTWKVIQRDGYRSLKLVYERKDAHKFEVTAVTFGEIQEITYSGSIDNVVVEWDMKTGRKRREFRCSSLGWRVMCISIIDNRVFACFQDSTARIWSLLDGALITQLVGRGGRYHVAKVLPQSNQALPQSNQESNQVVPQSNQALPQSNQALRQSNQALPKSNQALPKSNQALPQNNQALPQGNQALPQSNQALPPSNQALPQSNQAFSDGSHYTVQHWNLADGRLLTSFKGHTDEVTSLCLLPGGQHLITGSRDKTLKLWRISDGSLESEFFFEQAVLAVACSPKGRVVVGLGNGQLCFIHIN